MQIKTRIRTKEVRVAVQEAYIKYVANRYEVLAADNDANEEVNNERIVITSKATATKKLASYKENKIMNEVLSN